VVRVCGVCLCGVGAFGVLGGSRDMCGRVVYACVEWGRLVCLVVRVICVGWGVWCGCGGGS
jgi:hypothetical protein